MPYPTATPRPYFSPTDLMTVQAQLNLELIYVARIRSLIGNARTVSSTVFWENTNTLAKVVADLEVSADAKPNAVALQIAEGTLYTVLSAAGGVDGGAVFGVQATVMAAAFGTTVVS